MTKETSRFTANDPCTTPGCNWKYGFHICLDPEKYDMGREAPVESNSRAKVGNRRAAGVRTPEQRANMSAAVALRHEKNRAAHAARNAKIVKAYETDWMSILDISIEYSIGKDTIKRILEDSGVTIRPRGVNKQVVYFEANAKTIGLEHTEEGKSLEEIAVKYGISRASVARKFKAAGVKIRMGRQKPTKYAFN